MLLASVPYTSNVLIILTCSALQNSVSLNTRFEPVNPLLEVIVHSLLLEHLSDTDINSRSKGISRFVSLSRQMVVKFRKREIVAGGQVNGNGGCVREVTFIDFSVPPFGSGI